ncbi:MAG: putative zinc-binding metallopeptidase [Bacteroidaceae bacterium]|nr:putative zinc-binding metallopeptidase [Bacteroidaceae bacterium]
MNYKILPLLLGMTACFLSCSEETGEDIIVVRQKAQTPFDRWLDTNYVAPYNIQYLYRFEDRESDMNYYTVPAEYNKAVALAHLVKYLCLEAYDEVGGIAFTRANFPKMIFTIGEWEYRNNGTFILGTAEGGKKILLTGVNELDQHIGSPEEMNEYYLKTIHHEFTHILNQTREYSATFKQITGTGYVADNWSRAPYDTGNLQRGFISPYSQYDDKEDFAEMLSMYICHSPGQWNEWMQLAGPIGAQLLEAKLAVVRQYMQSAWRIDIDRLRSTLQRRQADLAAGRLSLGEELYEEP